MKEKPNPLAGLVDAMKAHGRWLAQAEPRPSAPLIKPAPAAMKPPTPPVQTVAKIDKPRKVADKIYCAARFTRGQIAKIDRILLSTHKERGVRLSQSDILKLAIDRLPAVALEEREISEILAVNGRKQLNR